MKDQEDKLNELEREIRQYKIALGLSWIGLFILISFNVLLFFSTYKTYLPSEDYNFTINTSDLNSYDDSQMRKMISQVDPLYLKSQRSITFSLENFSSEKASEDNVTVGQNRNNGDIYIMVNGRTNDQIKTTLCHELLHTHMKNNQYAHDIIYHLANQKVCFG